MMALYVNWQEWEDEEMSYIWVLSVTFPSGIALES